MEIDALKKTLTKDDIIFILEDLGCHHIKSKKNYICAARPKGNNPTSIKVLLNENLSAFIYTKNDYKQRYPIQDIFSLVSYLANLIDRSEAIKYITNKLKITNFKLQFREEREIIIENKPNIPDKILSSNYMDQFIKCDEFTCIGSLLDEGVSMEAQMEFGVCFDVISNRYLIPIYNCDGELISAKARTLDKEYKQKGIPKFIYLESIHNSRYLFGYYHNYFHILAKGYVFIVESEKAILQAHSMGIYNVLATSKKCISDEQVKLLNDLNVAVVLAYDEDVGELELRAECRKLKCPSYYMIDKTLPKKSNCFDVGMNKVKEMFKNKIRFKE